MASIEIAPHIESVSVTLHDKAGSRLNPHPREIAAALAFARLAAPRPHAANLTLRSVASVPAPRAAGVLVFLLATIRERIYEVQLTKKALAIVFAFAAVFASKSAFASIPRSEILTPSNLDLRYELASPPPAPGDNAALLAAALDRAIPRPAPLARYAETRVGASNLLAAFEQQQPSGLNRALRKASALREFESASDETFAGGDPLNGRDPTGLLCETSNASGVWDWLQRCSQDALSVQQEFNRGVLSLKTPGRAVAGVVGTAKVIGKTAVGIGAVVVDQQLAQAGDLEAMMRQGQRVMAIASAARHPVNTLFDAHARAADNILAAEQSGHWFRASVEAGEIGSSDAAAVVGAAEGAVSLARVTTRAAARMGLMDLSASAGRAQFVVRQSAMLDADVGYNISPESWFTNHGSLGRSGTFVTDANGVSDFLGSAQSQQYRVGLFSGEGQVSYFKTWRLERGLGLERGSLLNGFRVTEVRGISGIHPRSPLIGNQFFRGPGVGLPNGAPEIVVDPVAASPWP